MPHKQFLVNGTLKEAIDVLAKRSVDIRSLGAPRLSRTYFDKTAILGDLGQNIASKWEGLDPAAQSALIGTGLGAGVGGIASMFDEDEDSSTAGSMLRGGIAGGAIGGGYGLLKKHWGRTDGLLEPPPADVLKPGEIWLPKVTDGRVDPKGGGKVTLDQAKIEAEAAKRGISPEQLTKELSDSLASTDPADSELFKDITKYTIKQPFSAMWHHPGASAAAGATMGGDIAYERARRQALDRAHPSVSATGGASGADEFHTSMREWLNEGVETGRFGDPTFDRNRGKPLSPKKHYPDPVTGEMVTREGASVDAPETSRWKNVTEGTIANPREWDAVSRSDDLRGLAEQASRGSDEAVEAFQQAARREGLVEIAGAEVGDMRAQLKNVTDRSNARAVANQGKFEAHALPSGWRSPVTGLQSPMITGQGGQGARSWYNPKGWRVRNPAVGLRRPYTHWETQAARPPSQLRTGGKYLRKGLLPFLAYTLLARNRTESTRVNEALEQMRPFMKPVK